MTMDRACLVGQPFGPTLHPMQASKQESLHVMPMLKRKGMCGKYVRYCTLYGLSLQYLLTSSYIILLSCPSNGPGGEQTDRLTVARLGGRSTLGPGGCVQCAVLTAANHSNLASTARARKAFA